MPTDASRTRALATAFLFATWSALVLGPLLAPAFGVDVDAVDSRVLVATTALVSLVLGRMWGFEADRYLEALVPGLEATASAASRETDRPDGADPLEYHADDVETVVRVLGDLGVPITEEDLDRVAEVTRTADDVLEAVDTLAEELDDSEASG